MYSLNLSEDNRILSACICLEGFEYTNIVDVLPEGDISDYKYIDGEYVYDPLPEPEPQPVEPTAEPQPVEPTADEIIDALFGIGGSGNE